MRYLSNIAHLSYSAEELHACVRKSDHWRFDLSPPEIKQQADTICDSFYAKRCPIAPLKTASLHGHIVFYPETFHDQLCLRRTNQILKQALRTSAPNRNDEIRQLLQVLATEPESRVLRTDISAFFESLPFDKLIVALQHDGLRNTSTLRHLRTLQEQLINKHGYTGLPRGLALSSTLADYSLTEFDHSILNRPHVLYYARYVDDICIVHFDDGHAMRTFIESSLPFSLRLNREKTCHVSMTAREKLDFLGYRIALGPNQKVSVSPSKLARTRKRIALTIRAFNQHPDFLLLRDRLRFLTSNIRFIKVGRDARVISGYRSVYQHCTPDAITPQLQQLDAFLHRLIWSKRYHVSIAVTQKLSPLQRKDLRRLSFVSSYRSGHSYSMSAKRIAIVKRAWLYE